MLRLTIMALIAATIAGPGAFIVSASESIAQQTPQPPPQTPVPPRPTRDCHDDPVIS